MHREGHLGAALLAYSPLGLVATAAGARQLALLGGLAAVALAMLPDQDQRIPFLQHRGLTHTVWFALAIGLPLGAVGALVGLEAGLQTAAVYGTYGFLVGAVTIGSHLLADALTPAGIQPWAPVRSHSYTYSIATASNPLANYLLLAGGGAATVMALAAGSAIAGGL